MATTLSLIRTRADEVLAAIAGTTASRLGHVRQSLFDTTEGQERREEILASIPYKISIDTAIEALVDTKPYHGNFSLWSVLFSNTFSSLAHSLLTTSFQILHSDVVEMCTSTLRYAPSFPLSHEAYTHTYHISQKLEQSFTTVSEEAHALLIHHQELQDSTRKLHQSLLIQICQVMGRLLQQLRLLSGVAGNKDYILGRLCYLLQHQIPSVDHRFRYRILRIDLERNLGIIFYINDNQKYGMIEAIAHLINPDYDEIGQDFINLEFIPQGTDTKPIVLALKKVFDVALAGGGAKSINFQELAAELTKITYDYKHWKNSQPSVMMEMEVHSR